VVVLNTVLSAAALARDVDILYLSCVDCSASHVSIVMCRQR
jgi:hypothetical protein